jgi:hypothetical protein
MIVHGIGVTACQAHDFTAHIGVGKQKSLTKIWQAGSRLICFGIGFELRHELPRLSSKKQHFTLPPDRLHGQCHSAVILRKFVSEDRDHGIDIKEHSQFADQQNTDRSHQTLCWLCAVARDSVAAHRGECT